MRTCTGRATWSEGERKSARMGARTYERILCPTILSVVNPCNDRPLRIPNYVLSLTFLV